MKANRVCALSDEGNCWSYQIKDCVFRFNLAVLSTLVNRHCALHTVHIVHLNKFKGYQKPCNCFVVPEVKTVEQDHVQVCSIPSVPRP